MPYQILNVPMKALFSPPRRTLAHTTHRTPHTQAHMQAESQAADRSASVSSSSCALLSVVSYLTFSLDDGGNKVQHDLAGFSS